MNDDIDLDSMTEAERRSYYFNKKGYRVNKPTFARHLIMRRIKKKYLKEGYFRGLTDNQMCKIVDRIMELKVKRLKYDGFINLGFGLGRIVLHPCDKNIRDFYGVTVSFKNTLDYWAKNPDAYRKKVVIRDFTSTKKMMYSWIRKTSKNNMAYYTFKPQRKLERQIFHDYLKGNIVILNK